MQQYMYVLERETTDRFHGSVSLDVGDVAHPYDTDAMLMRTIKETYKANDVIKGASSIPLNQVLEFYITVQSRSLFPLPDLPRRSCRAAALSFLELNLGGGSDGPAKSLPLVAVDAAADGKS